MSMTEQTRVVPTWTLADRLMKARRLAGLTQEVLADRLGISAKSVKRYEASTRPKRAILLAWSMTCGVDPDWLEHGTTPDEAPTPENPSVTSGYATHNGLALVVSLPTAA